MESEALMAVELGAGLGMLVCRVVVEDDVHGFARRHLNLNGVQEADELLVPVALQVVGPMTVPSKTFRAANSEVVPWRL